MKRRRILVLCPHFAPDTAPTGLIYTRLVAEHVEAGFEVRVVTALPWYRNHQIEAGWHGRPWRTEHTPWGCVTRVTPFPGKSKKNIFRRAAGFIGFTALVGLRGLFSGGVGKLHAVIAMSPPLTLGLTGRVIASVRRAPLIFNIQDVFPDAAIATGKISGPRLIGFAKWLEKLSYRLSHAVVLLSQDMQANVADKVAAGTRARLHVIPNFVDTKVVTPQNRMTPYRYELGLGDGPVVMYAGNLGFSQSTHLLIEAAKRMPGVSFLINGEGSTREELVASAVGLRNVFFGAFQPQERLAEVLATGDIHVVPLRGGLGNVSVPSKTYSILAAGRPLVASIDAATEVAKIVAESGAGLCVEPDNAEALVDAIDQILKMGDSGAGLGAKGRSWVEIHASPESVGKAYADLINDLANE